LEVSVGEELEKVMLPFDMGDENHFGSAAATDRTLALVLADAPENTAASDTERLAEYAQARGYHHPWGLHAIYQ
jgi:hypothetical protein